MTTTLMQAANSAADAVTRWYRGNSGESLSVLLERSREADEAYFADRDAHIDSAYPAFPLSSSQSGASPSSLCAGPARAVTSAARVRESLDPDGEPGGHDHVKEWGW